MQDTDYIRLVLKHLESQASPAEEAALKQWLEADEQHRLEFQTLEKIWQDSGKMLNSRSFDVEAALRKVEAAVTAMPAARARIISWKWTAAAAAVLLIAGSASWWYMSRPSMNLVRAETAMLRVPLPDGSIVHLRKGSSLQYSEAFAKGKDRTVQLSGEAFFEPVNNPAAPFRIQTARAILQDIGTSFLVREEGKTDEVMVVTGKVRVTEKNNPSNSIVLNEGQKALLKDDELTSVGPQNLNLISWKTGILEFRGESLPDVVADIADYYQTPVAISPELTEKARNTRITARFEHQPLNEVLEEIRLTTGLSTREERGTFVFFHK
ncbi:MAG TPA: FecR domain-containing protein [Puia sp.]